ncbi:MAG: hypothetical protein ACLPVW_18495 [Terriglobales bacterium]
MGRLAFAVLVLLLEIGGLASSSNLGKTSLVSGAVLPSTPGPEGTTPPTCRNGDSAQSSCGGGVPSGITYATTAQNWSQPRTTSLTGGSASNLTLTPCPVGVDTVSRFGYDVYISDGGRSEAVAVTGGTCTSGGASGTILFTPFYSHGPSAYTVESASSGIQETINAACGTDPTYYKNIQCNVTAPANGPGAPAHLLHTYNVYGTIFFHSSQSVLSGYGVSLNCLERGPCLQVGDRVSSNHFVSNTIQGFSFRTPANFSTNRAYAGVPIIKTVAGGGVRTITTAVAHGFRPGDLVVQLFTDDSRYWGDAMVASVPTTTSYTITSASTLSPQTTPGVVALAYEAILDNAGSTTLKDISYDLLAEVGSFNNFFDMWDDEAAAIDHFSNNGISLNHNANWTGSFIFSGGNRNFVSPSQLAPVITLRDSSITANFSNGVTDYNSNGLYIENTVIQATGPWQVYSANSTGNYQGAYLKNIYSESSTALNPLSPARSPFPGLGIAGLIAGTSSGAASFQIEGNGGPSGAFATGGTGTKHYSYFIVVNDMSTKTQSSPMRVLNWGSTGSDSIPVRWPRVANGTDVITYDVLRITTPAGVGAVYPYNGGCLGGPGGACGAVATALSQATACSGGLVCTYKDNRASSTTAYTIKQGNYVGNLSFWPGSIVAVNKTVNVDLEAANIVGVGLNGNPLQVANQCTGYGATSPGGYTVCLASITTFNDSVPNQTATLLTEGGTVGGGMTQSKGRLNFSESSSASIAAHHIITLIDSQPDLTRATTGYRPLASPNDTWIGTDVSARGAGLSAGQLAFGAPVSITDYIHATGDGVHTDWLERLTSKEKTFAVPVRINEGKTFTLGDGSPLSQMKIYSANNVPASHVPQQSCFDVVGKVGGLSKSDQIAGVTPPAGLGNLSLNAYPAHDGAIILHFCNASGSEAITPAGTYSFLAVR